MKKELPSELSCFYEIVPEKDLDEVLGGFRVYLFAGEDIARGLIGRGVRNKSFYLWLVRQGCAPTLIRSKV